MEPFGLQNPHPLFFIKDAVIKELYSIGDGKHLKMIIEKNGCLATALYFGMPADRFAFNEGDTVDFMCNMDLNDFRGTLSVQVVVKDVRMSEKDNLEKLHNEEIFRSIHSGNFNVPKDEIPVMSEFRAAFLYLKSILRGSGAEKQLSVWKCSRDLSRQYKVNCSHLKFNIILTVFEEMNLISLLRNDNDTVYVSLNATEGKVNIEDSEFLSKLIKI